jgi:hypothetical protein
LDNLVALICVENLTNYNPIDDDAEKEGNNQAYLKLNVSLFVNILQMKSLEKRTKKRTVIPDPNKRKAFSMNDI